LPVTGTVCKVARKDKASFGEIGSIIDHSLCLLKYLPRASQFVVDAFIVPLFPRKPVRRKSPAGNWGK
jgi:hypothetical protein